MSTAEMLAGTGSAYHVHREEDLALVKKKEFFFLFLKIDHLDLGTCHGTQRGTWTHGPRSIYQVHRGGILAPNKLFLFNFIFQN